MKKEIFKGYIAPKIELINFQPEQVFATSGEFNPSTHDGFDFGGWGEPTEF